MGLSSGLLRPPYPRGSVDIVRASFGHVSRHGLKKLPGISDWTITLQLGVSRHKAEDPEAPGQLPGGSDGRRPIPGRSNGQLRREPPQAASFWDALSPAEKRAFRSAARKRTFAAGSTVMTEGEQADYVIVILRGWTRISVQESGGVRILAECGPGQLVGERAAFHVSVRSATVTALEVVQALVMGTEDFAAFISAHPTVLDVVEGQVYSRLTGKQGAAGSGRPPVLNGENCTVVQTDVAGFAAATRTDEDRRIIRQAIFGMTRTALEPLWDQCSWADCGDGLLLVVPPQIPTTKVMEHLLSGLPAQVRRHNHIYGDSVRIQLRVAVDVGPVVSDPVGMSGAAINLTARLQDAPNLKHAISQHSANLGIVVSNFVYETAIRNGDGSIDPGSYDPVRVNVKETRITAWMQLIDPARPGIRA